MPASVCWSLHYAFEADFKKKDFSETDEQPKRNQSMNKFW